MASADATPLEPRQRVPGGPTGGVSVLLHAGDEPDFASSSRPSAHVAYPSGDAVVVTEIRAGIASPSPHVFRPSGDRTRPVTFASWAPGDAHRGLLAVGTRDELRLYAPPADDSPPSSPAGDDPDLLLHHRDDLVDASDDSSRWILLDRVALDADVTCAAWTHDAEGIVLATASGFVGACRLRRPEDGRPGDDIPETGDDRVQSRWSWRGRASEPQALVAAGPTLDAAAATAAETSLRAVAWRHDPDVDSGEMAPHPETRRAEHLKHPSPVTSLSWRPSPSGEMAPHPEEEALMTTCADGAIRVWTRPPAGFAADARGSRALVLAFVAQADARTSGEDPPAVFGARWVRVERGGEGADSRGRPGDGAGAELVAAACGDGTARAWLIEGGDRGSARARARARVGNRAVSVGARRASECGDARGVCVDARADVGV